MKRAALGAGLILVLTVGLSAGLAQGATWSGVDETVVEKYAAAAGRPSHPPLLDLGEGDLPLFFFLVAGAVGGFVAGYYFRELFPPKEKPRNVSR